MEQTHKFQSTLEILRILIHVPLTILVVLFALGLARPAFAATPPADKGDFAFVFRLDSEAKAKLPKARSPYTYRTQASTYEEAFKKAAQACFDHFKAGERLSEEVGLSVIDACANPRGT